MNRRKKIEWVETVLNCENWLLDVKLRETACANTQIWANVEFTLQLQFSHLDFLFTLMQVFSGC